MIIPTVGRIVHFYPSVEAKETGKQPHVAIVANVHDKRSVALAVITHNANLRPEQRVPLLQDGDTPPASGPFAEWMPYQKSIAAGAAPTLHAVPPVA